MDETASRGQPQDEELRAAAARWETVEARFRGARERRGRWTIALRLALLAGGLALSSWAWTALDARQATREVLSVVAVALLVGAAILLAVLLEVRARRAERRAENERAALWSEHHHELQRLRRAIAKHGHGTSS
jgi:thiol:disulfide interchange protein